MRVIPRSLIVLIAAAAALCPTPVIALAGLDNELSTVDGVGRTMNIQQWDILINGVTPLDQNPLTREWFHTGRAVYHVIGDDADNFKGTLELGYQIAFPWQMGNGLSFTYTTPNVNLDQSTVPGIFAQQGSLVITSPPILPGISVAVNVGNGPGLHEVSTFSVPVSGADGAVAVAGAHGTVSGAAGGVTLRPFARLLSDDGDSVTTYGEPLEMH